MSRFTLDTYVLEDSTAEDVADAVIENEKQREPFFIQNLDEASRRIQYFQTMMPRVGIFYAIKSNDNEALLKLVASLGLGFDCATPGEIHKILKLGVNPRSIIFASPIKLPEWMVYARNSGITHATFDSSSELKRIKQHWPEARLLLRLRVDGDSVYRLGEKFGCDFETEAIELLEEAASLNIKVVGVAFHVGSVCISEDSHATGIRLAKSLFDHETRMGREMKILDIGGGFLSENTSDIDEVSRLINRSLEEFFPDNKVQIIAEPGRYISDSCMTLYCSINSVKRVKKNDEYINMIYLNDGIYGTLQYAESWQTVEKFEVSSPKYYLRKIQVEKQKNKKIKEPLEKTILWGYSLDSTDRVLRDFEVLLPRCTYLDWLVFPLRGAYTIVFCSSFGCFQQPQIRSVISKELWRKVKRSDVYTVEDFIVDPDLSAPLVSTLPKVLNVKRYIQSVEPNVELLL
ncbi:unnamed protein product [Leptosia nina]|uniref:ornithine decarboxylase n=1 Tax=Leptosia nina TaxID=320188 RepID=A0AAV1JYM1_9NEOP